MQKDNSLCTEEKPEAVKVYEDVLLGRIQRFPFNFFSSSGVIDYTNTCIPIIKYLIEKRLKWNREDVCKYLTRKTFHQNSLSGMLSHYFDDSPYEALNTAYPGEYKPWELKGCMRNYWTKQTGILATRWLFDEKLNWDISKICSSLSVQVFRDNGLSGMLRTCFNDSPTEAVICSYPEEVELDENHELIRPIKVKYRRKI